MICAGLRLGVSETSALRRGNAKLLSHYASENDEVDRTTLYSLERIQPSPVSGERWKRLLNSAHQVEGEQAQLVAKAEAGDLGAVRELIRAKGVRRRELGKIAHAAHLPSCGAFI